MSDKKVKLIMDTVEDLVSSFLNVDRREDEELPRGAIEELINNKSITVDEIVCKFKKELLDGIES